jgi:hypothetical protein
MARNRNFSGILNLVMKMDCAMNEVTDATATNAAILD